MGSQLSEMTMREIQTFCQEWQAYLYSLRGRVSKGHLDFATRVVRVANFGWEQGQLRPVRDLAPYDLYSLMCPALGVEPYMLICRLTEADFADDMDYRPEEIDFDAVRAAVPADDYGTRFALLQLEMLQMGILE